MTSLLYDNSSPQWNPSSTKIPQLVEIFEDKILPRELLVKETWVTHKMENVLWLPSEYRGTCSAVRSNVPALGQVSGRVAFFEFNLSDR